MPKSKSFSQWSIEDAVEEFGLTVDYTGKGIEYWIDNKEFITEEEAEKLAPLRAELINHITLWNELELEIFFISPLLAMLNMKDIGVQAFIEREIRATVDDWVISGEVDWIVAKGFGKPKAPFFCLKEFKKAKNSSNDPEGQLVVSMLAAQEKNKIMYPNSPFPVYGAYLLGRDWTFCVLQERHFIQSLPLLPTDESGLNKILCILKKLKEIIRESGR